MIKLLLFLGIILSIVKANGWFIVPMPVLVFCWVMSFFCWLIYSYLQRSRKQTCKLLDGRKIKPPPEERLSHRMEHFVNCTCARGIPSHFPAITI